MLGFKIGIDNRRVETVYVYGPSFNMNEKKFKKGIVANNKFPE